jgi:hypothetical protein
MKLVMAKEGARKIENVDEGFNKEQVEKRKNQSLEESLKEFEESYQALITKVENLTDEQWLHQSGEACWKGKSGQPITVFSMFDYTYGGEYHEAGHAKQIKEALGF